MSITAFPKQPPVTVRSQYEGSLESICQRSTEELFKVGPRRLLLELTITLSELQRPPGRLIRFPPVLPRAADAGLSGAASGRTIPAKPSGAQMAAASVTIERWRKESTTREKHLAVTAMMRRSEGVTLSALAGLTGWRQHTLRSFIGSLGRKGKKVAEEKDAAGERTYKLCGAPHNL